MFLLYFVPYYSLFSYNIHIFSISFISNNIFPTLFAYYMDYSKIRLFSLFLAQVRKMKVFLEKT